MGKLLNIVTRLHESTPRDFTGRMMNNKVHCMETAKKYGEEYWDGDRCYGYGGYIYMPGRWKPVAQALINEYGLGPGSRVLDVGCGKGYLLYEMLLIEPELTVCGFDISEHALADSKQEIKPFLFAHRAQDVYPYKGNDFDLVISLGTLHNLRLFDLKTALSEIERVGKRAYIMLESYRNEEELFNLQCWALTAETFLDTDEWKWLYTHFGYTGDYEFIFFNSR